ncbi:uncharacterized protein LOC119371704 [Rhipicephalus sanguineus]|uniref:uncharacterized protein LOC119371704 n=1 Tax=Rhipicephalus sanguineus TaxID=34632 RepID=UPI001892E207|nr:uncharacterized protein LOC119371704 [Rhipicephalus sanguineus]
MFIRGGSYRVNLTEAAEKYVKRKNITGDVISWGLTKGYDYWKQYPHSTQQAVTAAVKWMIYGDCNPHKYRGPRKTKCTGYFSWSNHEYIVCPFHLKYNTTLPVRYPGLKPEIFELDLNHLPAKAEHKMWNRPRQSDEKKVFDTKCHYVARVNFDGYFVYLEKQGSNLSWNAVHITEIASATEGLIVKRGKLTYNVWGTLHEAMWCYE